MCHRPEHELMFSADFSRSLSSGVGLIHTNPNWQCESWSPDVSVLDTPHACHWLPQTSQHFIRAAAAARTHTHKHARTHTHALTHTRTRAHTHTQREHRNYITNTSFLECPWKFFQHFTIFVKIFFSSPMSSKVVFQHCTITVRVLCHECPQKLVFIILIYLCPQKLVFNILYIFKDIFLSWMSSS